MNKKKITAIGLSAVVLSSVLTASTIFASDDRWGFSFKVGSYQSNVRSKPRYRDTKTPDNPWKVYLEASQEGKGTITSFWLEVKDGTNVSGTRKVVQGDRPAYTGAYSSANQVKVYLTAENNNYNNKVYGVSGFWDEETW